MSLWFPRHAATAAQTEAEALHETITAPEGEAKGEEDTKPSEDRSLAAKPGKGRLMGQEAAAGRVGGGSRRIVYDAAAIDALLDRSGMEADQARTGAARNDWIHLPRLGRAELCGQGLRLQSLPNPCLHV